MKLAMSLTKYFLMLDDGAINLNYKNVLLILFILLFVPNCLKSFLFVLYNNIFAS